MLFTLALILLLFLMYAFVVVAFVFIAASKYKRGFHALRGTRNCAIGVFHIKIYGCMLQHLNIQFQ